MGVLQTRGADIAWHGEGQAQAPVLLFSHSLGCDLTMWAPQVAHFAGRYRVLRFDLRGHGSSSAPEGDYTLDMLGSDALAVLDEAGVERATFIGISIGGIIGQWLALNAPHRLERLVIANTAARIGDASTWEQRIATVHRDGPRALVDAIMERWFTRGFREREPACVARFHEVFVATAPAGYAGCAAALRDADLRPAVSRIAVPTLIVGGREDPTTTVADARFLNEQIEGSRLELLDAAHLSNAEAADAFNRAVSDFLGD